MESHCQCSKQAEFALMIFNLKNHSVDDRWTVKEQVLQEVRLTRDECPEKKVAVSRDTAT